uniref:7TM_GPCR_Srx domain-containing protein n=1 Tax=Steinernema glaseri TaxID=37863 RepID=A0A1I7ZYU7_9BILA
MRAVTYICIGEGLLSAVTLIVNSIVMTGLLLKGKQRSTHLSMLLIKMAFDCGFAIGVVDAPFIVFITGNVVESLEAAIGTLHLLVSIDRLCAMKQPLNYPDISSKIQKMTIVLITATFGVCFTLYAVTRHDPAPHRGYQLSQFINSSVQSTIHIVTFVVFLVSLVASGFFLKEFRKYVNNRVTAESSSEDHHARKVNLVVMYLLTSEFMLLIIPSFTEIVLNRIFHLNTVYRYGPIVHPFIVLYTTLCAVLFFCKLSNKKW